MLTDRNFRDYCYEGLGLGIFMFSAGLFSVIIEHPSLYVYNHIHSSFLRRFLVGISMGLTAMFIFTAPFGRRSGAYINPAVTWVQYLLGNIDRKDAIFYSLFQFIGGVVGMYLVYLLMPKLISNPAINYVVTVPGSAGTAVAFIAEMTISFMIITTVLFTTDSKRLSKHTPLFVSILLMLLITFESPYSGTSLNPARTFASAIVANQWTVFWLYCIAPTLGMWVGKIFFEWRKALGREK